MSHRPITILLLLIPTFPTATSRADLVIFDTLPNTGSLVISPEAGQTFTTPDATTLGADVRLDNILIAGPTTQTGNTTYALQLFIDQDQNEGSWGLGTILAETASQTIGAGQQGTFDFIPFNLVLDPSTVYGYRFTDGAGTAIAVEIGSVLGNTGTGAAGGRLYSSSNGFLNIDVASQITTTGVPEPASAVALGLGGLVFVMVCRRKWRSRARAG